MAKFRATHPDRYHGVGPFNDWNPDATRDEIQKIKALRLKGVMLPTLHLGVFYSAWPLARRPRTETSHKRLRHCEF